jgi:nickel/cobalt transporter (NicO) family protein
LDLWQSFMATIGQMQSGVMRSLAAELRAGGIGAMLLAGGLGALHALTPGHGKAALVAYFLGHEAQITKGLRIALSGALLHVVSGFVAFLILRFVLGQAPAMFGRGSPTFTMVGYAFVMLAGVMMVVKGLRSGHGHDHDGGHALTAGIGLLPCPLTISVLGFAWLQSSAVMVGVVLVSLALGISLTIGLVVLGAILARKGLGAALAPFLPRLERSSRVLQISAGGAIIAFAGYAIWRG